jgi:hypothetical protein
MIAQHPRDAFAATLAAVHLHGLAGDVMREKVGAHSMVATDLLVGLPEAFARTRGAAMEKPVPWQAWLPTPRDFSSNRRASDHGICADDEKAWPEEAV